MSAACALTMRNHLPAKRSLPPQKKKNTSWLREASGVEKPEFWGSAALLQICGVSIVITRCRVRTQNIHRVVRRTFQFWWRTQCRVNENSEQKMTASTDSHKPNGITSYMTRHLRRHHPGSFDRERIPNRYRT